MNKEGLQSLISDWVPELEFYEEESQYLNILVKPDYLHDLMSQLKSNKDTRFDYLFCLSGVDWGEELGVVYHLESTIHRHNIVVKVKTSDRENPVLDTVSLFLSTYLRRYARLQCRSLPPLHLLPSLSQT